jgi:hypothetical protein
MSFKSSKDRLSSNGSSRDMHTHVKDMDDDVHLYDDIVAKIPKQQDRIRDMELGVLMIDG